MIKPVILAGGSGTRLWPLSRKSYPKQFSAVLGPRSPFQDTAMRLSAEGYDAPLVVAADEFRFIVEEQLSETGINDAAILLEPLGRNTAAAVLSAALALESTPETIMLVCPSDHLIPDDAGFRAAVAQGREAAANGAIITFGISPTRPETGYGYLELTAKSEASKPVTKLASFVEKPDHDRAESFLKGGKHLWNAGIFMFRVDTILRAFKTHAPEMVAPGRAAVSMSYPDLGFTRLDTDAYGRLPDISIDHAVMEHAADLQVVPFTGYWSDLGSWTAVWESTDRTEDGNALTGEATAIDCTNTLLRSEDSDIQLVGLGLEGIAAVAMGDAVLVANMDRADEMRAVVRELKAKKARQAEEFTRCHRPWGFYETLSLGRRFQVKRIVVKPGAALSLQSHLHRSEHWVVVHGSAEVTVDETKQLLSENQSVYIPLGAVHRLENPGKVPLQLIEVQTGSYLGEDDIIRYEDVYDRAPNPAVAQG